MSKQKPRKNHASGTVSVKIIKGTRKYTLTDDPIEKVIEFLREIDKYK